MISQIKTNLRKHYNLDIKTIIIIIVSCFIGLYIASIYITILIPPIPPHPEIPTPFAIEYLPNISSPTNVCFEIKIINKEYEPLEEDLLKVFVFDNEGHSVSNNYTYGWIHINSKKGYVATGDILYVTNMTFKSGYRVGVRDLRFSGIAIDEIKFSNFEAYSVLYIPYAAQIYYEINPNAVNINYEFSNESWSLTSDTFWNIYTVYSPTIDITQIMEVIIFDY